MQHRIASDNRVSWVVAVAGAACVGVAGSSAQAVVAPYVADANTLHLYHFDEAPGAADPGNPILDYTLGTAINLTNTGGPDGRDNVGGGGYQAAAAPGFGNAFDILASGNGTYATIATATTGGVRSAGAVLQSSLQGASGAFTYEALIRVNTLAGSEQIILSHDGNQAGSSSGTTGRGFILRLIDTNSDSSVDTLGFFYGVPSTSHNKVLPTSGDHALATDTWFHVAVAYTGAEGAADNLAFYWTRLDSGVEAANSIGTTTMAADLASTADGNWLGVGAVTRGDFRFQLRGLVDEVRISDIARSSADFVFVPEPASLGLLAMASGALMRRARRG